MRQRVRGELFMSDGIHFTSKGDEALAEKLIGCFELDDRLRALWANP